jgi:uncharacterized membrane protein YfcA
VFEFPISDVTTYWWLPTLVALGISSLTSTAGVTGAFILLPFQVSVLGYVSPGVSATNLMYNVVAIPGGVWRYVREKRVLWPVALSTSLAALPGLLVGAVIRIKYLPDPRPFKLFVGIVLLYLSTRLIHGILRSMRKQDMNTPRSLQLSDQTFGWKELSWTFDGQRQRCPTGPLLILSSLVGIVGGIYGIGGGAILSPYLVAIYGVPIHAIAGAMLVSTYIVSVMGVLVYFVLSPLLTGTTAAGPDWLLGCAFGIGGMLGISLGAQLQKIVPPVVIKSVLAAALVFIAIKYITGYF